MAVLAWGEAGADKGFVYQAASYEGLTCSFLDVAFAAGGRVLSPDGKHAEIDSPQNLKALQLMVDGVKNGAAPPGVTTYMEEEARRYFEAGKATFMRNWVYAYALGEKKGTAVRGKFAVTPLPAFAGGGKAGVLGGANLVISAYSRNPGLSLKFIDYLTKPAVQAKLAAHYAQVPVLSSVYDDESVRKALPFADELKTAIAQAKSRPVSPVYPLISEAIYQNVNAALAGKVAPQTALKQAQAQITKALGTF